METKDFIIEGMSCDHCVKAVKRALQDVEGVEIDTVEIGHAAVEYNAGTVPDSKIISAIEDAGYKVSEVK